MRAINSAGDSPFSLTGKFETGTSLATAVYNVGHVPASFSLSQNYPNPFNPTTTIEYDVPMRSVVNISVYDVLGRKVKTLVDGVERPGSYSVTFDAASLPSGVYLCRMSAGSFWQSIKIVLVK